MSSRPGSTLSMQITGKTILVIGLGLLVGLVLRLFQLDLQTFTHPEFYLPALNLPDFVVTPRARFTIPAILREALFHDKHPPGYHILMLAWNLNIGTEVFQIRLSSVLFGMAGIIAVPWFIRVNGGSGFGGFAVWLLAMHGFHIFWSQQARPWGLLGALGLITTGMLVSLARRPRIPLMIGYGLLAGYGMWIDYYFWPIFCAQVLWVVLHELDRERLTLALSGIALAVIIATPMATYFWLHLTEQEPHVRVATWQDPLRFLQFGGVLLRSGLRATVGGFSLPFEVLTTITGAVALAFGLRPWKGSRREHVATPQARSRSHFAILALFAVLMTVWTWNALYGLVGGRKIFLVSLLGPYAVLAGWILVHVLWRPIVRQSTRFAPVRVVCSFMRDPVTAVPLAAFGAVMAVTLMKPLLAEYAMVCFTPFVVVIAARGIERMGRWRTPVGAIVLLIFAASVWQYRTSRFSPIEYKGLGLQLAELVTPGQALVMRNTWATAPLHYYLPPDRFRIVPISHLPGTEPPLGIQLPDTVWLVAVGDDDVMIDERLAFVRRFAPDHVPVTRISTGTSGALKAVRVDTTSTEGGASGDPRDPG